MSDEYATTPSEEAAPFTIISAGLPRPVIIHLLHQSESVNTPIGELCEALEVEFSNPEKATGRITITSYGDEGVSLCDATEAMNHIVHTALDVYRDVPGVEEAIRRVNLSGGSLSMSLIGEQVLYSVNIPDCGEARWILPLDASQMTVEELLSSGESVTHIGADTLKMIMGEWMGDDTTGLSEDVSKFIETGKRLIRDEVGQISVPGMVGVYAAFINRDWDHVSEYISELHAALEHQIKLVDTLRDALADARPGDGF